MKANVRSKMARGRDAGVSPVIAVILMVAITVVLAATVYVWVSGLSTQESGPERATVRATTNDFDGDSANDWIVLSLTDGANEPYAESVVTVRMIHSNAVKNATSQGVVNATQFLLCLDPNINTVSCGTNWVGAASSWDVGESLYLACQGSGSHKISVELRGAAILDNFDLKCDEAAT